MIGEAPAPAGPPVRLQTHVWNPLGARRALLLHGLGNDGTCWWRLASALAREGWLVLAPDLRSHGRSPTADDHRLATLAADVRVLGEGWDVVVGHSLGGAVAALLAAEPDVARAALLLDPVLELTPTQRALVRGMRDTDVGHLDPTAVAAAHPSWDPRDVHRKVLAAAMVTPDVVDAVLDDNDPWDLVEVVRASPTRTHLVAADPATDALLPPTLLDALGDGARCTGEVLAGAGHALPREAPDAVLAAVRQLTGPAPS